MPSAVATWASIGSPDVADGEDVVPRGPTGVVRRQEPAIVGLETDVLEAERLGHRFATDGHEDSVRRVLARLAVGVVRGDANAAVVGP